ncbi:MAG: methylenetetrahydrofolate reductase [NAD(P)H] [Desulfobulbus propionicus]|nr:MAG: methylenetetrahydrofolate reductase [NAD(P)H] [Desulfobulbus propionicus]
MHIHEIVQQSSPGVSLEFFPPKSRQDWPKFLNVASKLKVLDPRFVSVTYGAGGSTQDNTLEICQELIANCGYEVMPHLTGVAADVEKINAFLQALAPMGIDNVLALRGDRPGNFSGSDDELFTGFPYAADLVAHVRKNFPRLAIGVAGFPEAHIEAPSIAADLEVMKKKADAGADFVVTQLYFDNRVYFDYVDRLKQRGVQIPVIPGVLPIRSLTSLRFILEMCNARVPGQLINALGKADADGGNKAVYEIGVAYARKQVKELLDGGAPGVHLYTLNHADMCLEVMDGLL